MVATRPTSASGVAAASAAVTAGEAVAIAGASRARLVPSPATASVATRSDPSSAESPAAAQVPTLIARFTPSSTSS